MSKRPKIYATHNLVERRLQQGFTQEHVAELCGVTTSFYAQVERKERSLSAKLAKKIYKSLNSSFRFLFYVVNPRRKSG